MSYSLERLLELFQGKDFVTNNFYTLDDKYKYVEIVNLHSAVSLIVDIDEKYAIEAQQRKHEYKLHKKTVDGDITSGQLDEAELRSNYREIDHISKALESEEKLQELYDKPISLKGEEVKSQRKIIGCFCQLERFKHCFKNIPFKLTLFEDDCLGVLTEDSKVEAFFVQDYKIKKRKIFVSTSLNNFFTCDNIEQSIDKIGTQFYDILDTIHKVETNKIHSMIEQKRSVQSQSKKIMTIKTTLRKTISEYQAKHADLIEKQQSLHRKLKELQKQPNLSVNITRHEDAIRSNEQTLQEYVKKIMETRKQLDEIVLTVDQIFFDNTVMLSRITENFKLLETLKIN